MSIFGCTRWHGNASAARTAYFGELVNTWHVDTLNDFVDFFSVDTTDAAAIPWAQHLPFYNVHYCLRRTRSIDGFKPATKLFLAASLGAPAVIERANDEARRLLPADYPYFAESTELAEARRVLRRVTETFGKDEWQLCQGRDVCDRLLSPGAGPGFDRIDDADPGSARLTNHRCADASARRGAAR